MTLAPVLFVVSMWLPYCVLCLPSVQIDILVNCAGGNVAGATVGPADSFFKMPTAAMQQVFDLNIIGTVLPSQVFGESMHAGGRGNIINISSMSAQSAITRVCGYSAAKAAVDNFTKWLAVELALKYGESFRVNAISPGFFIAEQNRALLTNPDGSYTDRGKSIVANTPMKRFGRCVRAVMPNARAMPIPRCSACTCLLEKPPITNACLRDHL